MNDTIEATDLYAMVFSDDCKCESKTHLSGKVTCSGAVTSAFLANCGPTLMVCDNMTRAVNDVIERDSGFCKDCGDRVRDCWKVVAI